MGWFSQFFSIKPSIESTWLELPLEKWPLLAIDLELTSLDKASSQITSIGWVPAYKQYIQLDQARYTMVQTDADLAQSPVIHGLTTSDLEKGEPLTKALEPLLSMLPTHIGVFHHHQLDIAAIQLACASLGTTLPAMICLDTLLLEQYLFHKTNQPIPPSGLTLGACRQRYDLPPAPAHNALDDAMATLELLLAQLAALGLNASSPLSELLHTNALTQMA